MNENSDPVNYSRGRFNRAAIKRQLMLVSNVTRGGKFTRVSEATIDEIEARAEAKIREMKDKNITSPVGGSVKCPAGESFTTGAGRERLAEAFDNFIASECQRIVNDTRTGSTL